MWQPRPAISRDSSSSVRPGVAPRAPVADDRDDAARGEPERGARVAAVGDVGVELRLPGREALRVEPALEAGLALAHEQRAGLEQVAARLRGQLVAPREADLAALDVHARAHRRPRRGERHVAAGHAARPQLAQRHAAGADEEAAHHRVGDAAGGAPRLEPLGPPQDRDAQLRGRRGMRDGVDRGARAVGQGDAGAGKGPGAGLLECRGQGDGHGGSFTAQGGRHVNML